MSVSVGVGNVGAEFLIRKMWETVDFFILLSV